jgi:hypothetical protein
MTDILATAADSAYGYHALNLVGSVKRNSDVFDRIVVFDLGLSGDQRDLLGAVPGVELRLVPPFVPHWAQCFTWKPWAWMQVEADRVFWLDAGTSVLRSLEPALGRIRDTGSFAVSQGNRVSDILPPDYFELYGLSPAYAERPYAAAGIVGFVPGGEFFRRVLVPTYEDCLAGRNLGFSAEEVVAKNRPDPMDSPPLRNCRHFRWDQSVLNAHLLRELPDLSLADLDEYGGWRSAHDHPRQVIWHHRRAGRLRYLRRVPYSGPGASRKRAVSARLHLQWWWKLRPRHLSLATYRLKAQKTLRALRS